MATGPFRSRPQRLGAGIVLLAVLAAMRPAGAQGLAGPQEPLRCRGDALVPLTALQPRPLLELRYAYPYNFMGETLYDRPLARLRCPVAMALQAVQRDLAAEGLGLKVWDAYRPPAVQQRMWDRIRDPRYVSDPAVNLGRHTRGTSVDVTLVDRSGRELAMPTDFDVFSEAARAVPEPGSGAAPPAGSPADHALRLQRAMARHGFVVLPSEWWHFDWQDWQQLPPIRE